MFFGLKILLWEWVIMRVGLLDSGGTEYGDESWVTWGWESSFCEHRDEVGAWGMLDGCMVSWFAREEGD